MQNKMLVVKYHGMVVGRLALTPDNLMAFAYDKGRFQNVICSEFSSGESS